MAFHAIHGTADNAADGFDRVNEFTRKAALRAINTVKTRLPPGHDLSNLHPHGLSVGSIS